MCRSLTLSWTNRKVHIFNVDEFINDINKKLNFEIPLKLKKLRSTFDMITRDVYGNHVQVGFLRYASSPMGGHGMDSHSGNNLPINNLSAWKESFFVLVTSKAFSVKGEQVDEVMLHETDMPHWLDLDTLYEFRIENDKDDSEFVNKYTCKQFQVIHPILKEGLKGNHNFTLETKETLLCFGSEYCKETNRWLAAVKKGKQNLEEISRTKANALTVNIDPLIGLFKQKVSSINQ